MKRSVVINAPLDSAYPASVIVRNTESDLVRAVVEISMDCGQITSRANALKVRDILVNTGSWPFASPHPRLLYCAENWPWLDAGSGAAISDNLFYGFPDSGGLAGSFSGYPTPAVAAADIAAEYGDFSTISTDPDDLGGAEITVLSGRQYISQLYKVHARDPNFHETIAEYGKWSAEAN